MTSLSDIQEEYEFLDGDDRRETVTSMPGVERLSLDNLMPVAQECVDLGIPVMALFPVIDGSLKTPDGREAFNPDGLVPRVVRGALRRTPIGPRSKTTVR